MAKKRLSALAKEYGITFDEIHEIVMNNLEEDMVTGKGKNLWLSEAGQVLIDDLIPMVSIHRGIVVAQAPNPRYVMVKTKEDTRKLPVQIPLALSGKLTGKLIYFEADHSGQQPKFKWIKAPKRK